MCIISRGDLLRILVISSLLVWAAAYTVHFESKTVCPTDCSPQPEILCTIQEELECPAAREPVDNEVFAGPPSGLRIVLTHISQREGTHINISFAPPNDGTHSHVRGFALEAVRLQSTATSPIALSFNAIGEVAALNGRVDPNQNTPDVCYVYNTSGTNWSQENWNLTFIRECDTFYDEHHLLYSLYTLPRLVGDERMQQAIVTIKQPYYKDLDEAGNWMFQSVIYNNSCQQEVIAEFLQMPDEYGFESYRVYLLLRNSSLCNSASNCDRTADHIPGQKMQKVVFDNVLLDVEYKVQIKADDPYHDSQTKCLCQSGCRDGRRCVATNSAVFSMPRDHPSCFLPPVATDSTDYPVLAGKQLGIGIAVGLFVALILGVFVVFVHHKKTASGKNENFIKGGDADNIINEHITKGGDVGNIINEHFIKGGDVKNIIRAECISVSSLAIEGCVGPEPSVSLSIWASRDSILSDFVEQFYCALLLLGDANLDNITPPHEAVIITRSDARLVDAMHMVSAAEEELQKKLRPDRVVLHLGTNDITTQNHQPDDIIAILYKAVGRIRQRFPEAKIALCSIPPRKEVKGQSTTEVKLSNKVAQKVNKVMKELGSCGRAKIQYVDNWTPLHGAKGGLLKRFFEDDGTGIHLSSEGKALLMQQIMENYDSGFVDAVPAAITIQ